MICRTKSGQTRDLVIWAELIPVHGEECMLAITIDDTERKRADDALRFSEERFRSAMEHSPIGMAIASLEGRWIEVNPALCRIVGYTREEMLTRDFQSLTHPDDLEVTLEYARQMLAREIETYQMEKRYLHKDGHVVWGQLNVSLLWDSDGKPRHFVSQIQDISGRKLAEEARKSLEIQLHQAQKMESLGTLAGGIAHDFNNILGAILGNVELAGLDAGAHPVIQESLVAIGKAAHRARDLVRQILAFSRQQTPELRPVKLTTVVGEATRLLRATLPATLEIRTHVDTRCPHIQADPTQLHQIIMNLGINAWHAMVDGMGAIDISIKNLEVDVALSATHADLKPGPYLCLSVADNGKGMDKATLGRIFDPFFTTKAPGEGTGLGLAVAHGIMKSHFGAIRVESQPGKGTTFFLYFPVRKVTVEAVTLEAVEATPAEVSAGEGQHIVYVDDEAPLVRLVTILLKQLGYRVSGFTNAVEALAAFRAEPGQFSLLITDLSMPGMSGLEMASEVHRLRPELRTVVVSGYVTDELLKQARACGVSEIIQKPYTFQEMSESIHRLLGR
jgi:PAS domain S-box-containing protein